MAFRNPCAHRRRLQPRRRPGGRVFRAETPNHALGQAGDWMNEIYPRWAAAHGVFLVTPVNWYHVPASLKLMIDRLVCADGGNPDPTTTHGKDPQLAKEVELAG